MCGAAQRSDERERETARRGKTHCVELSSILSPFNLSSSPPPTIVLYNCTITNKQQQTTITNYPLSYPVLSSPVATRYCASYHPPERPQSHRDISTTPIHTHTPIHPYIPAPIQLALSCLYRALPHLASSCQSCQSHFEACLPCHSSKISSDLVVLAFHSHNHQTA